MLQWASTIRVPYSSKFQLWFITWTTILYSCSFCLVIFFAATLLLSSQYVCVEELEVGTGTEPEKSQNIAWELANKLHENAQHIHTILNEEAAQDGGQNHALGGLMLPDAMEATRKKADELIKSLGGLVSYLNQFTELVKETGFENIAGMTWCTRCRLPSED